MDSDGSSSFVVIFETGEEVAAGLKSFAAKNQLASASFKAIGALSGAKVGWFNWETKSYEIAAEFNEQIEVLSLIGDVALQDGKPVVHAHLIVGKKDGTAHGGHLMEAYVRPTLEVMLTESSQPLRKVVDQESGLALIEP
jgi:predicted DNA-binding protein with PD1-like motif